ASTTATGCRSTTSKTRSTTRRGTSVAAPPPSTSRPSRSRSSTDRYLGKSNAYRCGIHGQRRHCPVGVGPAEDPPFSGHVVLEQAPTDPAPGPRRHGGNRGVL